MSGFEGMDDLVQDFLVESYEGLDQLDQDFVALESEASAEVLARIFRTVHTIKGSAGFLGLGQLERLAHAGESLMSRLRDGDLVLTPVMTTALLQMVDGVRHILGCVEVDRSEGERRYDGLVELLNALRDGTSQPEQPEQPEEQPQQPDEPEQPHQPGAAAPAQAAETDPAEDAAPRGARAPAEAARVAAIARLQADQLDPAGRPRAAPGAAAPASAPAPAAALAAQSTGRATDAPRPPGPSAADSSIRVDVGLLDELMNLVGELVLARNQVLQCSASRRDQAFSNTTQRLNLITTSLQERVMKTRMQPIGTVWNKLPRVVRDLSVAVGKQVDVEMDGADTELDKTIIEAIKDPMTHLIRNSVDHGIERPEVRAERGKPPAGLVSLRAYHEGGQVVIEITDDGAGVDTDRIRAKAVAKGLLTADQAARLSDRDTLSLVFLPGLSTAESVSNLSGRGVGMDVVRTNIEKIGGTVDLQSTPGVGTTFKVKIPLTLAIIPGLMVSAGGDGYAIPQVNVQELVRLKGDAARSAIETVHGAPVYRLRGRLLPLVHLDEVLGLDRAHDRADDPEHGPADERADERADGRAVVRIVVLNAGGVQFGLVVDEVNDTEEIVVKPLGEYFQDSVYAGCTIMGDGRVAVILDVVSLSERAGITSEEQAVEEAPADAVDTERRAGTMLIVRVGGDRRMAVPLERVVRLETFEASSVEWSGDQAVVQYRGELLPLLGFVPAAADVPAGEDRRRLSVVVCSDSGHDLGIVVDQVLDVADHDIAVHQASGAAGELATAVIQGRVTDILDVARLVRSEGVARFRRMEPAASEAASSVA
jgi:two-component system chemotaxis sensor kinase CheA